MIWQIISPGFDVLNNFPTNQTDSPLLSPPKSLGDNVKMSLFHCRSFFEMRARFLHNIYFAWTFQGPLAYAILPQYFAQSEYFFHSILCELVEAPPYVEDLEKGP